MYGRTKVHHLKLCIYKTMTSPGWGLHSPLLATSTNTKDSMYRYKNALKHIIFALSVIFYTLRNVVIHTFRVAHTTPPSSSVYVFY